MRDLKTCPVEVLDDIFKATRESQGTENALAAIKYVLFDDETVFKGTKPVENKYLYISNENNARKKAMILQTDDLAHILVKYCMESFGLRGRNFTITDDEFVLNQKRIDRLEITAYEMIEQVAYAAMGNTYTAYNYLFSNYGILMDVVDYMLNERYVRELKDILDNFGGIIDNKELSTETRYAYYDAYQRIDEDFEEIKRNNQDYIK